MEFFARWHPPEWLTAHPDYTGLDIFKYRLLGKYDNYVKAWRKCLDLESCNKVSWSQFKKACTEILGIESSRIPGIWRALDDDMSGFVTLAELDLASNEVLVKFKRWCAEYFGSVKACFKYIDENQGNNITFGQLLKCCQEFYFKGDESEVKTLFQALDADDRT